MSVASTVRVRVDSTPPVPGQVRIGYGSGTELWSRADTIVANFDAATDEESGVTSYDVQLIGTQPVCDGSPYDRVHGTVMASVNIPCSDESTFQVAIMTKLNHAETYRVVVVARNGAGLEAEASSRDVVVDLSGRNLDVSSPLVLNDDGSHFEYLPSFQVPVGWTASLATPNREQLIRMCQTYRSTDNANFEVCEGMRAVQGRSRDKPPRLGGANPAIASRGAQTPRCHSHSAGRRASCSISTGCPSRIARTRRILFSRPRHRQRRPCRPRASMHRH